MAGEYSTARTRVTYSNLTLNMFDPYVVILTIFSSPRSPARGAIRSNYHLLVSAPTSRRYSSVSGLLALLG